MPKRDELTNGEVVWIRIPYFGQVKMGKVASREKLYELFGIYKLCTFYRDSEEYFRINGYTESLHMESRNVLYKSLMDEGIGTDEPFYIVDPPDYELGFGDVLRCIRPGEVNYDHLCLEKLEDGMDRAVFFQAKHGETYAQYAETIFLLTRGHNAPTKRQIETILGI